MTRYEYDCEGRLARVWDANHPTTTDPDEATRYLYDPLDRLVTVLQPWGGTGGGDVATSYLYDPQDHLISVTDGEGNETTYRYSDRDLLMEEISPVSGTTRHLYGNGGELVVTKDARNVEISRTIDAAGRVTLVEYSGAPELDVSFTYGDNDTAHEIGRLVAIERHGLAHEYTYDEFGRIIGDGALMLGYDKHSEGDSEGGRA